MTKRVTTLKYVVHTNYTALHAGPLYAAIVGDALVRGVDPRASVRTTLHPLPLTAAQVGRPVLRWETRPTTQTSSLTHHTCVYTYYPQVRACPARRPADSAVTNAPPPPPPFPPSAAGHGHQQLPSQHGRDVHPAGRALRARVLRGLRRARERGEAGPSNRRSLWPLPHHHHSQVKAKHQQLVSGVSIPAYWLATFVWDNITYQVRRQSPRDLVSYFAPLSTPHHPSSTVDPPLSLPTSRPPSFANRSGGS